MVRRIIGTVLKKSIETIATDGEKIKALRITKGMKRSELAKSIALSDRSIRFIEAGERNPGEYTLKKIAAVFNIGVDYFNDTTISGKELNDAGMFEEIYKKYEINSAIKADEIIEKTTDMVEEDKLAASEKVESVEQMIPLLLRLMTETEMNEEKDLKEMRRKVQKCLDDACMKIEQILDSIKPSMYAENMDTYKNTVEILYVLKNMKYPMDE